MAGARVAPTKVTSNLAQAGMLGADAQTKAQQTQDTTNNPSNNQPQSATPLVLDYTTIRDVDYYIEFNVYTYLRGLQGIQPGRQKKAIIRLPLLSSITSSYVMNYTAQDMSMFYDALISGAKSIVDLTSQNGQASDDFRSSIQKGIGAFEQTALNAAAMNGEYTGILDNTLGVAKNPRQEATFIGVGMRQHAFAFNLVPRNADETALIQQIIYNMKLFQHPDISAAAGTASGAFLTFPDEFVITFKSKNNTANNSMLQVPIIPDSFLANFDIIYNPTGNVRFFDDNAPTGYMFQMGFIEANQLTRKDIETGGY